MIEFREEISGEIVRVVMLPEHSLNIKLPTSDCDHCQGLEDVAWRMQNLIGKYKLKISMHFYKFYFLIACAQKDDIFDSE